MSLPDFFAIHPVFTREELVRHLTETGGGEPNASTVRALLRYHQTTGRILSVRRGLYATVPPGSTPSSALVDAYLVGALGCPGGVLAYHAALELHGLAYSTFEVVQILVPRLQRGWSFRGVEYRPVKPRESLGAAALTLGVETMDRRGIDLRVTTAARTLVDVLDRPDLAGGWEEVWRSLETLRVVDDAEVLAYLGRLGNATTSAMVGFFLEQHPGLLDVAGETLTHLESLRPKGRQYLDRKAGGRLAARWNLIVPESLWQRSWEEMS
jgi:predicted transcriptional regulator of viral defense system